VLAGAAAVVASAAPLAGGAVTAKGADPGVGVVGGGEAHPVSSARIASAACRFVTEMGASVAKPTKRTFKFGIPAAL